MHPSVDLANPELFRNRDLGALHRKLSWRITHQGHVPSVLLGASTSAQAAALESLSFGVQVRDLWAADGKKGTRAMRKKALTDYLRALGALGALFTAI